MIRELQIWLGRAGVFGLIVVADLVIWRRVEWLWMLADPTLLLVIIVTTFQGWRSGLLAAAFGAWGTSLFSTLPAWIHLMAWLGVVAIIWSTSRRMLTSRSTASFLGLVAIGTATYAIMLGGLVWITTLFWSDSVRPVWTTWWTYAGIHLLLHPLIGWLVWLLSHRSRHYTSAGVNPRQSF